MVYLVVPLCLDSFQVKEPFFHLRLHLEDLYYRGLIKPLTKGKEGRLYLRELALGLGVRRTQYSIWKFLETFS